MEALLKNTFNKISSAYELVADVTVATATTQVDFSGLNFSKDDDLLLVSDIYNPTAGGVQYKLFPNNNTTENNYYRQILYTDGATVGAGRANNNEVSNVNASNNSFAITNIKLTNSGYFISQTNENRNYKTSSLSLMNQYVTSTFTAASITSLRISGSIANSIGIGSRFQLYRLKAKKVADIIVSSATTQVDITGLDIDKDSEYMLVSDINNTSVDNSQIRLYPNGNNTTTNYYTQILNANSTNVSANRYNLNLMNLVNTGTKAFSISKIKLTNNGYYVVQTTNQRAYGGSGIEIYNEYMTSTFTLTSITSLLIQSEIANAIGIGSRFTLYKMK